MRGSFGVASTTSTSRHLACNAGVACENAPRPSSEMYYTRLFGLEGVSQRFQRSPRGSPGISQRFQRYPRGLPKVPE
eukprot:37400-Pyramimonas_sp.AAC.1